MFFFYFFISSVSGISFLQVDDSSLTILASSIVAESEDLSRLSDSFSESILAIDQSIDGSVSASVESAVAVLDARISSLETELMINERQIQDKIKEIALVEQKCEEFLSCLDCTSTSTCVWCDAGFCAEGDKSGPYQKECKSFSYGKCPSIECSDYTTCSTCVANTCDWCDSTEVCSESTNGDPGSCPESSFYWKKGQQCDLDYDPGSEIRFVDSYLNYNPSVSVDQYALALENELSDLYAENARLKAEISVLSANQQNIQELGAKIQEMQVKGFHVEPIEDLSGNVQEMYDAEVAENREMMQEIAENSANEVITYAENVIVANTALEIQEIYEVNNAISDEMDQMENEANETIQEIMEKLKDMNVTVTTDNNGNVTSAA
jgi:hypothetical protein